MKKNKILVFEHKLQIWKLSVRVLFYCTYIRWMLWWRVDDCWSIGLPTHAKIIDFRFGLWMWESNYFFNCRDFVYSRVYWFSISSWEMKHRDKIIFMYGLKCVFSVVMMNGMKWNGIGFLVALCVLLFRIRFRWMMYGFFSAVYVCS